MPHGVIDLDRLRQSWPAPSGDRSNFGMVVRNPRGVSGNCLTAGAVRLAVADVIKNVGWR